MNSQPQQVLQPLKPRLELVPFSFWQAAMPLSQGAGPSLDQLQQAMGEQLTALGHPGAEPLRWAITGHDPGRGLRLEGIALSSVAGTAGSTEGNSHMASAAAAALAEKALGEKALGEKACAEKACAETAIAETAIPETAIPETAIPGTAIPGTATFVSPNLQA